MSQPAPLYNVPELHLSMNPAPSGEGTYTVVDRNGIRSDEFEYKDGKLHGTYTRYRPDGQTKHLECGFVAGVRQGPFLTWHPDGTPACEGTCKDGVLVGRLRQWDDGGAVIETVPDESQPGVVHRTSYYSYPLPRPAKRSFEVFRDSKPDGVHRKWAVTGRVTEEQEFKAGSSVSTICTQWGTHESNVTNEIKVYDGDKKLISCRTEWYYRDGRLGEVYERSVADPEVITRVRMMIDKKGRDCVLGDGEVEVWKAGKAIVDPYDTDVTNESTNVVSTSAPRESVVGNVTTITTVETIEKVKVRTIRKGETKGPWVYIRLTVPADAQRVTPVDTDLKYKSRVSHAKVEQIVDREGKEYKEAVSVVFGGQTLVYRVGEVVRPDTFNPNPNVECGAGINVHCHKDQCVVWFDA